MQSYYYSRSAAYQMPIRGLLVGLGGLNFKKKSEWWFFFFLFLFNFVFFFLFFPFFHSLCLPFFYSPKRMLHPCSSWPLWSIQCDCMHVWVFLAAMALNPSASFQPIPSLPSAAKPTHLSTPDTQKMEKDGESKGKGECPTWMPSYTTWTHIECHLLLKHLFLK